MVKALFICDGYHAKKVLDSHQTYFLQYSKTTFCKNYFFLGWTKILRFMVYTVYDAIMTDACRHGYTVEAEMN